MTDIPQREVICVRVVCHTLGPVQSGGQLSQNHWSIYLLTPDNGSVRLNMEWVPGSANDKGTFSITRHLYAMTNSAVKVFDYQVANGMKVSNFFTSLRDKKRQNYNMTPTGVGCRFWV